MALLAVLVDVLVALVEKGPLADPRTYRRFSFITCKGTQGGTIALVQAFDMNLLK